MSLAGVREGMRVVAADGLTLEPQVARHAEAMFEVLSDPAIYEYENQPPPSIEWLRERFARLESRRSPDGSEQWLNWIVRLPTSELIGYVQATVLPNGEASIAYELASAYWGHGLAYRAVQAMLDELSVRYGVGRVRAVFKSGNHRSMRLLERLGFVLASRDAHLARDVEPGERLMELGLLSSEERTMRNSAGQAAGSERHSVVDPVRSCDELGA